MKKEIYSEIDSNRFGLEIGKVDEDFFFQDDFKKQIQSFKDDKFDLIITRINLNNLDLINNLEGIGFKLCDVQSILYYPFKSHDKSILPKQNESYTIREFNKTDIDAIVDITAKSFNGYGGHYFNDNRLNQKDSLDAYLDWVYNSCINKKIADQIFVSEKDGEIAGYISVKTFTRNSQKLADGVLGAVNPKHRGKGVFQDLAIRLIEWSILNGCDGVENNVLINNYPVIKTYTNLGYKPNKSTVTLHGWVDKMK
jgi:ribosomal protein S18 acetylase RimI-like enzyme|tara:strand:+ start:2664 stop:3425 length:762 start_codon:yes stop_codon:yes gene_type:complete